ncbi:MAG: hypothetical protein U1F77_09945 [Kiritimatiellia bacterium]
MPHLPHLLAASDAGAIVWLVILIFWGFSTVMQKGREKKEAEKRRARQQSGSRGPAAAPPLPRREAASPEEELKRFLEEITGRKTAPAPPPPVAAPEPPRRVIVRKREPEPLIQFDEPPPPAPAPVVATPHNAYAQTSAEIGSIHEGDAYAPLGEIEDIEKLMDRQAAALYSGETMVRPDSMLVNLSKIRVPLMTLPLVSYKSVKHAAYRPALKGNRHALQQALIARVILGPCKAFGDDVSSPGKSGR